MPKLGKRPDKRRETFRSSANAPANGGTKNKKQFIII